MFTNQSYSRKKWTAEESRLMLANYNSNATDKNDEFIKLSQLLKRNFNSIKAQVNRFEAIGIKTPQDFEKHYGDFEGYICNFSKEIPVKLDSDPELFRLSLKQMIPSEIPLFKFAPFDKVKITDFNLNYEGRVIRCIWENHNILYDVELWVNGEPRRREFYEFQLKGDQNV